MSDNSKSRTRGKGFLTEDDIAYLLGEKDNLPEGSAQRQKHLKIRNRLENAIHDFQVIERGLPEKDIKQVFEPMYEWGRERRRLNEEGRYSAAPESKELVASMISLFNFFAYSMALSRMGEVVDLRDAIVEEGFERGLRRYSLRTGGDYIDYRADFEISIAQREAMQNHLVHIDREISERPDAAQKILSLYNQNKIPGDFAQKLWDDYVGQQSE